MSYLICKQIKLYKNGKLTVKVACNNITPKKYYATEILGTNIEDKLCNLLKLISSGEIQFRTEKILNNKLVNIINVVLCTKVNEEYKLNRWTVRDILNISNVDNFIKIYNNKLTESEKIFLKTGIVENYQTEILENFIMLCRECKII